MTAHTTANDTAAADTSAPSDDDNDARATASEATGMRQLPDGQFLETKQIIEILRHAQHDIRHERVPYGAKSNAFCLVHNNKNMERHKSGQRRAFDDDCGAWQSSGGRLFSICD